MRFVAGLILGVLLTIGAAYIHDTWVGAPGPDTQSRRLVNWDVVHRNVNDLAANVKAEWANLTGHLHDKT